MVLTQEGSSPFEAGKQYALFGRLTNSESDPVQFTVGKTVQKFSSSLTREGKKYVYVSEDSSLPFWKEICQILSVTMLIMILISGEKHMDGIIH